MNIISTSPAQGWFFYFKSVNKVIYYRVATWGTTDQGSVIGLLPAQKNDGDFSLVTPPNSEFGGYVHWDDLNEEQQKSAIGGYMNDKMVLETLE